MKRTSAQPPLAKSRADPCADPDFAPATAAPAQRDAQRDAQRQAPRHALILRACHWLAAISMIGMILSGWQIYNASPLLPFTIPREITLGGWLGGAIAWHLTAMWGLFAAGGLYLLWGLTSGHFRRDLRPRSPATAVAEIAAALRLRLSHDHHGYNEVQRFAYSFAILVSLLAVLSGLAIYKPVQFAPLTTLLGDYPTARIIHFAAMCAIVAFLAIHLVMVAIVPSSLRAMITGNPTGNPNRGPGA